MADELRTVYQTAVYLKISERHVKFLIREDKLERQRLGKAGKWYVTVTSIEKYTGEVYKAAEGPWDPTAPQGAG